jgi:hypothetical protein
MPGTCHPSKVSFTSLSKAASNGLFEELRVFCFKAAVVVEERSKALISCRKRNMTYSYGAGEGYRERMKLSGRIWILRSGLAQESSIQFNLSCDWLVL